MLPESTLLIKAHSEFLDPRCLPNPRTTSLNLFNSHSNYSKTFSSSTTHDCRLISRNYQTSLLKKKEVRKVGSQAKLTLLQSQRIQAASRDKIGLLVWLYYPKVSSKRPSPRIFTCQDNFMASKTDYEEVPIKINEYLKLPHKL